MATESFPSKHAWIGKAALYGAGAVAIGLVGYGIYSFLAGFSSGPGKSISDCESNWKTAYQGYIQQYDAFLKQNGGKPLSAQQEAALQPYVTAMNDAEGCLVSVANASTAGFWNAITYTALAVVGVTGAYYAFRAYLNRPGSGFLRNGSEARAAYRNARAQADLDSGAISSEDAQAQVAATNDQVAAEADSESAALGNAAEGVEKSAVASGDSSLLVQAQEFVQEVVDTISETLADVYAWFADLV